MAYPSILMFKNANFGGKEVTIWAPDSPPNAADPKTIYTQATFSLFHNNHFNDKMSSFVALDVPVTNWPRNNHFIFFENYGYGGRFSASFYNPDRSVSYVGNYWNDIASSAVVINHPTQSPYAISMQQLTEATRLNDKIYNEVANLNNSLPWPLKKLLVNPIKYLFQLKADGSPYIQADIPFLVEFVHPFSNDHVDVLLDLQFGYNNGTLELQIFDWQISGIYGFWEFLISLYDQFTNNSIINEMNGFISTINAGLAPLFGGVSTSLVKIPLPYLMPGFAPVNSPVDTVLTQILDAAVQSALGLPNPPTGLNVYDLQFPLNNPQGDYSAGDANYDVTVVIPYL